MLAGAASAATVDCNSYLQVNGNTLDNLIAITTGSGNACQIGDLLITGVVYTPIANAPATGGITVTVQNNPPTNSPGAERGLLFGGSGGFGATTQFSITFNGVLCVAGNSTGCLSQTNGAAPPDFISSASTVLIEGQSEVTNPAGINDGVQTTWTVTPNAESAVGGTLIPGNNPGASGFALYTGTGGFTNFTLTDNGGGQLNSIEGDVEETLGPEPGTMFLMGGALLGLASVARKLRKKA